MADADDQRDARLGAARDPVIEVLIVDDHAMVADAFTTAIEREADMTVVAHATSCREAAQVAARERPDVVLMDYRLRGDEDGADATALVRQVHPGVRVLMVTSASDDRALHRALEADVDGYLLKDQPVEELLDAIRTVAAGGAAYAPALVGRIVAKVAGAPTPPNQLSDREVEVLQALAEGQTTAAMAAEMHISVNTVRNHVQRVLTKLGAHSRLEAVAAGIRAGIIQAP